MAQALRPFPQYTTINTWDGGGDHSGHSSYHAGVVKLDKRFAQGFTFTTSYVFSKLFTDADTYWITDNPRAADHYNRRLEKSIGSYDVTHNFKFAGVYELPFGKGKKLVNNGWAALGSSATGGWPSSAPTPADARSASAPASACRCSPAAACRGCPPTTAGAPPSRATSSTPRWTASSSPRRSSERSPPTPSATRPA